MSLLPVILLGLAFANTAAGLVAVYQAQPRLLTLERRGLVRGPVPQRWGGGNLAWFRFIWATPLPEDRKTLRRLLLIARVTQVLMPVLIFGAVAAMDADAAACEHRPATCASHYDGPPPVRLEVRAVESAPR